MTFKFEKTEREWGEWEVTAQGYNDIGMQWKHKLLTVKPLQKLSLQYHFLRSEHWFILSGQGLLLVETPDMTRTIYAMLPGEAYHIDKGNIHQVKNTSAVDDLVISEIQYGIQCTEEDIVRLPEEEGLV